MRSRVVSTFLSTLGFVALSGSVAVAFAPGCGSDSNNNTGGGDGGIDDLFKDGGTDGPCKGLQCQVEQCGVGKSTTLSGTVFAPNGTLALYNVVVYVPNAALAPLNEGPSCDRCGDVSGEPVTATVTDEKGRFTLKNVPSGKDIPLVIQVGKWRRELKIPEVKGCTDTPIDKADTRLPKNKSEGHIPKMAVTTGQCDHLACLLPKLGLDASEYTAPSGDGRLNIFRGSAHADQGPPTPAPAPAGSPDAPDLWGSVDSLKKYDMVILSCECGPHDETKPESAKTALYEYAKLGGRVFTSHYHYTWFQNSPFAEVKGLAEWVGDEPAGHAEDGSDPPFLVDQSFPKGKAFANWLVNVGASSKQGEIPINQVRQDVVGVKKGQATRWVYNHPQSNPETTKYLTFNAPVDKPVEQQCGKAVFGDMHISGASTTTLPDDKFPGSCPTGLTPEEKALIFLFFDLASCVQKEDDAPVIPVK